MNPTTNGGHRVALIFHASTVNPDFHHGLLGLAPEVAIPLQEIPTRGVLEDPIPKDPTLYRLYEMLQIYSTTVKALVHEMFGDGIMSAVDFEFDIARVEDPKGDRVLVTLNGKFLPFRKW